MPGGVNYLGLLVLKVVSIASHVLCTPGSFGTAVRGFNVFLQLLAHYCCSNVKNSVLQSSRPLVEDIDLIFDPIKCPQVGRGVS